MDDIEVISTPLIRTPLPPNVPGAWFDEQAVTDVKDFLGKLHHINGSWAGHSFKLEPWQVEYIVGPVFGWKHPVTDGFPRGRRIFRTVFCGMPRKQGKSSLCSALGLYLLAGDGEEGAQVFAAAAAKEQAALVFKPSKQMAETWPALAKQTKRLGNLIEYPKRNAYYRVVSSDGNLQHGLNVHAAIIDEVHAHRKRDVIDALETGVGSRDQPLIIFITTADDGDEQSIFAEKYDYLEQVANGTIDDASFFGVYFGAAESDDPFSDETIAKANPGAGVTVQWDYLRQKAQEAKSSPGALNRYLRLHLNIRTRAVTRWLDPNTYDEGAGIVVEPDLVGRDCYGGVDLASTSDFTALALVFPALDDDGKPRHPSTDPDVDVVMRFWIPAAAVARRKALRTTLEDWAARGFLTITDGDVVDQSVIRSQIEADASTFHINALGYDPWNAAFLPALGEEGGLNVFPVQQSTPRLNAPSKMLERLIGRRRFHHGGQPVLRWQASHVNVFSDSQGNIKPDRKNGERIDGVAACVDALAAYLEDAGDDVSCYEQRGLLSV